MGNEQLKFLQIVTLVLPENSFPSKNEYFSNDVIFSALSIGMIIPSGMKFLYKEFTISEFSVFTMVISVGELRYRFMTFSKYPNANGFSAADVPFNSRIFSEILMNFRYINVL